MNDVQKQVEDAEKAFNHFVDLYEDACSARGLLVFFRDEIKFIKAAIRAQRDAQKPISSPPENGLDLEALKRELFVGITNNFSNPMNAEIACINVGYVIDWLAKHGYLAPGWRA